MKCGSSFLDQGLTSVSSPSIVHDCSNLLFDLYETGVQLGLLEVSSQQKKTAELAKDYLVSESTIDRALIIISDLVSELVFTAGRIERARVSNLYDLAKSLQSFHALLANHDLQSSIRQALNSDLLMMHKDSIGIRIDLPNEVSQLTDLHQEFHSFPFGLNAAVLWVPLTRISRYRGTLSYFPRQHKTAPILYRGDLNKQNKLLAAGHLQEAQKSGTLCVDLDSLGEARYLDTYPGVCYIFSTMLPHESIIADPSCEAVRLTCQARFFDLNDSFFAWRQRRYSFGYGLKNPLQAWRLWEEYCGEQ
jgi:hypothetical protein